MGGPYEDREQTAVKHKVLTRYLSGFVPIVGAWASDIAYIDCLAGPWRSADPALKDTSFARAIGTVELPGCSACQHERSECHRESCDAGPVKPRLTAAQEPTSPPQPRCLSPHSLHGILAITKLSTGPTRLRTCAQDQSSVSDPRAGWRTYRTLGTVH